MKLHLYNKSYIQVLIKPDVITYVNKMLSTVQIDQYKKTYAIEKAIVSGYWASIFDSKEQFVKKNPKDFIYNNGFDYIYGPHKIKLIIGKPNKYNKSSGYTQEFSIPRFAIKDSTDTTLVYCAYRFPFIDFVGWSTSDPSNFTTQKNTLIIFAGSDKLKSFKEHTYLSKKVKVPYVD